MKKRKFLNIALTSIMLLSTILTPQISYAISDNLNGNGKEDSQVEPEDAADGDIEEQIIVDEGSGEGEPAEVQEIDSENDGEPDEEQTPAEDEEVGSEELQTPDNKGPPEEVEVDESEEIAPTTLHIPFAAVEKNLVTDFKFILNPGANQIVVENDSFEEVNLDEMNAVILDYGFTKPNDLDIAAGDTFNIALPEVFKGVVSSNQPIIIDGVTVATYNVKGNQVVITFSEFANNYDDVEMHVNLSAEFNVDVFENQQEVVVEVPYAEGTSFTATIRAEQQEYDGTDKKEADSPYILGENDEKVPVDRNPEFIDWTVRANDSMSTFENATIIDDLGDNLEIVDGTFIVERIIRNRNNEEIDREKVTDFTVTPSENGFELGLGNIEDAYDITYTTRVTRPDGGGTYTINNNARIILDDSETPVSDSFEGTWSGDIPTIDKSVKAFDENAKNVVEWQVEYNYSLEELGSDVILTDTLTHGDVLLDTVRVMEVETDIDGNVTSEVGSVDVMPVLDEDGNMIIPNLDANGKAYYITFKSTVPVGLVNETIVNTISDNYENTDNAEVTVNTVPTGGKVGEQLVDDEGRPYIKWTITMNSQKVDISSINITDVFNGDYLTFDLDDTKLFKDGTGVENYTVKPYTHEDGRIGFDLSVTDAGPHVYTFEYLTYYTTAGMQQPEIANDAELIFDKGIGDGIGVDIGFKQTGPKAGIEKSGEYVLNEETGLQEIEWTIVFNNSRIMLENPLITDEFTSGNYEFIDGSLNMTENDVEFTEYDFNKVEIKAEDGTTNNGFTLKINKDTNARYIITYRTTADDAGNEDQRNDVILTWQGGKEHADYTVNKRDPGISKFGDVEINADGSKTVNWTVNFNTNSNVIYDFVLTDTNLPASVTISDIKVTSGDNDVTGEFDISDPENGIFTVSNDSLNAKPYQLTYSTTLSAEEEKKEVKNTASADYRGDNQTAEATIDNPELGVQKDAVGRVEKTDEGDFINWEITANTDTAKHLVNLVNPVLADTIPADQRLIADSIKVIRPESQSAVIIDPTDITTTDNSFSINLPDGAYQYIVTFQTEILEYPSVNEQLDRYTNSTELSSTGYDSVTDDAYIDYFADGTNNNSTKEGSQNDDTENIDWNLTLNPLGLTINDALITDQLSDNQTYVEDSIKVTNTEGNEISSAILDVSEDKQSFEITFKSGTIDQLVNITYSTRLNEELIGNYDVTNNVKIFGGTEQRELHTITESTTASQWLFGGGGSGRTVELRVNKQNNQGEEPVSIEGAHFNLERIGLNNERIEVEVGIKTNENGVIVKGDIRAGRYILTETSTPPPYQVLDEPIYLLIGYANPETHPEDEYTVTITDEEWNVGSHSHASAEGNRITVNNDVVTDSVTARKVWGRLPGMPTPVFLSNPLQIFASETTPNVYFKLYRQLSWDGEYEEVPNTEILSVPATGEVVWNNIDQYAPDGTWYNFSVKEVDAAGNDYTPDGYMKVEDDINVYNLEVNPEIKANKKLIGRDLHAGEFEFVLRDENRDKVVATATNDASGNIRFSNFLKLTEEQEEILANYYSNDTVNLTYYLSESPSELSGVISDETEYQIEVTLSVDQYTGELDIRYDYPNGQPIFSNTYEAGPTQESIQFEAHKILEGQAIEEKQFTFELLASDGERIETKTNEADGSVLFDPITYETAGIYNYKIREVEGALDIGLSYDSREYNVQVVVTDNMEGNLVADVKYLDGPAEFKNTYTADPDSVVLEAHKKISGQQLEGDQFEFELVDSEGNVLQEKGNNGEGQVIFDEITYDTAGEHTYTIREVAGSQGGVTYDDNKFIVTVEVTDDGEGQLTAIAKYVNGPANFENDYTTQPDSVVIEGAKILEGQDLAINQFTFELRNEDDEFIDSTTNNADGQIIFDEISYDTAGTYNYTVREVEGTQGGITYDDTVFNVVVEVRDDGEGQLTAAANYVNGPISFTNTYEANPDSIVIKASKELKGQKLVNDQFEFELINEAGHILERVKNNADGQIVFSEITYDETGDHTYTIREVEGAQGGVTYDSNEHEVQVSVMDDGEGNLIAEITNLEKPIIFTNTYETNPDSVVVEAQKVLEGKDLVADQFIFELVDEEDNVIQTKNNRLGQVIFDEITYDEIGEYNYTIREVEGAQKGVTYDETEYPVTVNVIDNGQGQLEAAVSYVDGPAEFTNNYTPASDSVVLEAEKILEGQTLIDDQFTYELVDESGEVVQTTTNNANGQIIFDEIPYEDAGSRTYIIREVEGTQGGMVYDQATYTVVVDIVDEGGQLVATPNYINGPSTFTNTYTATPDSVVLEARKILQGQELRNNQFSFELVDADGETLQTVQNNTNGQIIFDEMTYTYEDIGTHDYTIREVEGTQGGVTYDPTEFNITVEVTDGREGQIIATESYVDGPAAFNNDYTPASDSIAVEVEKILEGQVLQNNQFSFELVAEDGGRVLEATNNADGQVIFDEIIYNEVGEHTYTIREVSGVQGGMTYDPTEFEVTVSVTDDGEGQLTATLNEGNEPLVFTNNYVPAPDSIVIEADKVLEGQDLSSGQFEFELLDANGAVLQKVENNANGQITFDEITYDEVGETTYRIREVEGTQGGVTYDPAEFEAVVTVTDDGEGQLYAKVEYSASEVTFNNSYTAQESVAAIEASKILEGQDLQANQFEFVLVDEAGNVVQTVSNNADGQILFDEIFYEAVGEYTYTIRELEGTQGGVTYDSTAFDVVVTVTDNLEGKLETNVVYNEDPVFTNNYEATPDSVVLEASKVLEGQELTDGQFEFELVDEEGRNLQTAINNADGKVTFNEITYDAVGEHTYTIREVQGNLGGINYDDTEYIIAVSVIDDGEGSLIAEVNYTDGPAAFKNTYEVAPDSVAFEAIKTLNGQNLVSGQFEFELVDETDEVVEKVSNNADGQVIFNEILYDEVGDHTYTIREVEGTQGGVTYDDSEYTVTVSVIDDSEGNLIAEATYVDGPAIFTNTYESAPDSVVIEATKVLNGKELVTDQFEFVLLDSDGNIIETVTNNANGQVFFNEIGYDKAGEYTYTIREIKGSQGGITYDTTAYTVVVLVTDDGEGNLTAVIEYVDGKVIFTNTYTEPEKPVEPSKPEEPGDPDPKDPTDPKDPEKPQEGTPGDPEDPTDPEESDGNGLPITGEAATYVGLAVTLLIVGITLAYYNRKSTN